MSSIILDIEQLYHQTFGGKPYHIGKVDDKPEKVVGGYNITQKKALNLTTDYLTKDSKGVEIWLPVWLGGLPKEVGDNGDLFLPYTVVRITGSSTIIRTPLAERRGSVKELYNVDDYKITIKGFFIDKERRLLPEKDLHALKAIHETGKAFTLYNKLTDIFLTNNQGMNPEEQQRVVLTGFDLPEVEGGRKYVRPFSMTLESDCVFTLEVA